MATPLLAELAARLSKLKPNPVALDATTLEAPGAAVVALLQAELGTPKLVLAGSAEIKLEKNETVLRVEGPLHEQEVAGISEPSVVAFFTVGKDGKGNAALLLELEIKAPTGWSLAKSLPELGALRGLEGLQLDPTLAPRFILRSEAGEVDAYGPRQTAGLNLRLGVVAGSGPLAALAPVLKFKSRACLDLAGPARIGKGAESLSLRGPAQGVEPTLSVGGIPVLTLSQPQAGITAVASPAGPSSEAVAAASAEAIGMAGFAGGTEVPLSLGTSLDSGPWTLSLLSGHPLSFAEVVRFVSALPLLGSLPEALSGAVSGEVEHWTMTLAGPVNQWTLAAVGIEVTVGDGWTVVPGVAEIAGIRLTLEVPVASSAPVTGSVAGALKIKGGPEIGVYVPLPVSSGEVLISAKSVLEFHGIGEVAELIGGVDLASHLPASVAEIGSFSLASLSLAIDLPKLTVTNLALTLKAKQWALVSGKLELTDLEISLAIAEPFTSPALGGRFLGTLVVGEEGVLVSVGRSSPREDWRLEVEFEPFVLPTIGEIASLAGISEAEMGEKLPKPLASAELELAELALTADLSKPALETFGLELRNVAPWKVTEKFSIVEADIAVALDWRSGPLVTTGRLLAVLEFGVKPGQVLLGLEADREADGSWLLSGQLEEPVLLGELVKTALGFEAPDGLLNIKVSPLSLTYHTGDGSYQFAAGAAWTPELGFELEVDAKVELSRQPKSGGGGGFAYSGLIEGDLKSHFGSDTLELSVGYQFQEPTDGKSKETYSYVFKLIFNTLTLSGSYVKAANGDGIVTLKLGGVTFGEIIGYLVHLVDPALPSTLSPPWDVLDKIHFEDLELVLNITRRTVGISDKIDLDLGIVDIETIALTYVSKGGSPTVEISITGSFLGQKFGAEEPLAWDMLNEQPPAAPGAGAALLDLKDLGLGQHLVLAPGATTVPAAVEQLHNVIAGAQKDPKPWEILRFDPQAGWLIGANFTVMGTVTVEIVFDDPVLYGAQISLTGAKAGPFAGLVFQILYRKVSADVGVYHIELQLPTLMRHLEFGEVSVTLPSLVLDIYTDGGFYIDLGFPYENNWSVAFGLQVFPFVGAGGFYFGRLTAADGATDLVPRISNGTFGPVIEFGVALAVGVGKEISEGPLSAGVSVTAQGIVTGVVAWFNPTSAAQASDRYYRIDGSLAIVGKLYGSVDFKVISVSISITATVTATVAIEAYAPIHLGLSVEVEVVASIKILFIRIHFTFSMHLDAGFTIGSQQATPWTLAAPGSPTPSPPPLTARRRLEGASHLLAAAAELRALGEEPRLQWKPAPVLASKQVAEVTLLPVITVAPVPEPGAQKDELTIAMTPALPSTPPPSGPPTPLAEVVPRAFDFLAQALLRWGIVTLTGTAPEFVTAVDLQLIYEDLTAPDISQRGFDYEDLRQFLADNLIFALVAPDLSRPSTEELNSAVLPMPPPLKMSPEGQPAVDFSAGPEVDAEYQRQVQEILEKLAVDYGYSRAPDPARGGEGEAARRTLVREGGEPIGEALFADWILAVARASLQAAINELKATRYEAVAAGESLAGVAAALAPTVTYYVRPGDTAASIAFLFGISSAELLAENGGSIEGKQTVQVPPPRTVADYYTLAGDTAASIASGWHVSQPALEAANPGVDFTQPATPVAIPVPAAFFELAAANLAAPLSGQTLPLTDLRYAVRSGDTLAAIAKAFGQGDDGAALAAANATAAGVLLPGAELKVKKADGTNPAYKIAAGDTLELIAAYMEVRNGAPAQPETAWFLSAVITANPAGEASRPWLLPTVERTANGLLKQTGTISYQPREADSFGLVGAYFALAQLHPQSLAPAIKAIETANPGISPSNLPVGTEIGLPVETHAIAAGETLAGIAGRFGLRASDLAAVNAEAPVLAANAELTLPAGLGYPVKAKTTLAELAAAVGLTVDGLVGRIGAVGGLFETGAALKRPNARQANVEELLRRIVGSGGTASAAGMSSHFMLHGLRLPKPPEPTAAVEALYRITGQQFPAPAIATTYAIEFEAAGGAAWAQPAIVYAPAKGETAAEIAAKFGISEARLLELNPGINPRQPPAEVLVPQATTKVTIDHETLAKQSPSTTLEPELEGTPEREVLFHAAPIRHSVGPRVPWTAPEPPRLPGTAPATGAPSIWRLPAALLSQIEAGQAASGAYLLGQVPKGEQVPEPPPEVASWSWATVLPLTVHRVASPAGGWLDGAYLLSGAEQGDRDRLLALWTHLLQKAGEAQLFLAYPAASGGGLVADAFASPASVAIVRSNLSTETHSGLGAASAEVTADTTTGTPPPATVAYASLAAPAQFLRLAWEASVTGTGGFYLDYRTTAGSGLPASAFPLGDEGQLQLIALLGDPASPDRELHPYTNAAVVADNLDPGKVEVFAYAKQGETTAVPTAPPGNVGFTLARKPPAEAEEPTASARTQALFSLLGFTLTGAGMQPPPFALPVGPKAAEGQWRYERTIPVYKLLSAPPPDLSVSLPPGADDPYAAIAKQPGAPGPFKGGSVALELAFRDVYGNELAAPPPLPPVPAPVGYYDPVRGLSSWPGASGHFELSGPSGQATFTARLGLGLDKYVPSPSNLFAAAVRTAAAHQVDYRQIHYQLGQADVTCAIDCSLVAPGAGPLIAGAAAKRPLQAFVMAAYLYLGAAQAVAAVEHEASAGELLSHIAARYVLTAAELANANAVADLAQLLEGPLTIPHDYAVRSSDTLAGIAGAGGIEVGTLLERNAAVPLQPGTALPTATATFTTRVADEPAMRPADTFASVAAFCGTTVAALAVANAANPGILTEIELTIDSVTVKVAKGASLEDVVTAFAAQGVKTTAAALAAAGASLPLLATGVPIAIANVAAKPGDQTGARFHAVVAGEKLAKIAAAESCTVFGLAVANAQLPNLLQPGAPVEVKGFTVAVGGDGSLAAVVDQLLAAAVTQGAGAAIGLGDLAAAIDEDPSILVTGAKLMVIDYVAQAKDSVESLARFSWFDRARLARLSAPAPPGVYAPGTALRLSTSSYAAQDGDSFAGVAAQFGIGVEELAEANLALAFKSGAKLAVPGAVRLGPNQPAGLYVPLDSTSSPTLAAVIAAFATDAPTLAAANATMPGLLAAEVTVTFGGQKTKTVAGSTLASVATALGTTPALLVADPVVAALPGLVAPGALFVGGAPAAKGRSLDGIAAALGVDRFELATANSAVVGLLAAGKQIVVEKIEDGKTVKAEATVAATDTFASLVRKLAETAPAVGLTDLIAAYGEDAGLFEPEAHLLVPPPEIEAGAGLSQPYVSEPLTPLEAWLAIARDPTLVDPAATEIAAVVSDKTPLAANLGAEGSLDPFARAFEAAYSERRLKLATGPPAGDGGRRLWVVDFGQPGIAEFQLEAGAARFYALEPVSRSLLGGTVEVAEYEPKSGSLGAVAKKEFAAVDLDAWMRMALEAIDLFLSPAVAVRARELEPTAFTAIVEAKRTIAEALASRVEEILADPEPAGLEEASEALRQSMLVSLATAYTTDAVVQFPVTVKSPFGEEDEATAPRLAGKPVVAKYRVPEAGSVASLVALLEVSREFLAEALAAVGGILTPGTTVAGSYRVTEADTVTSVAAALKVTPAALFAGLEAGTVTVTGGSFFQVGAVLPFGRVERQPTSADSFASLARYFGVDAADVAVANQDVPGKLAAGVKLEHAGLTYTTTGQETIAFAAQQLGLDVREFADDPAVVARTGLFNTSATLHGLQALPDLALSSLKVPLATGTRFASFLLATSADALHRSLFLDLDLAVDELEFQIEEVPAAPGYQSSEWLRFAVPLEGEALGGAVRLDAPRTDVPIALRSFPRLPLVTALEAAPTWPRASTIDEARQWQLEARLEYDLSAQDEVRLRLARGGPDEGFAQPGQTEGENLLQPLAQFAVAWPEMQNDVAALAAGGSEPRLEKLVAAFGQMVAGLVTALTAEFQPQLGSELEATTEFSLEAVNDPTDTRLESLELSLVPGEPTKEPPWPAIFRLGETGKEEELQATPVGSEAMRYEYATPVQPFEPITHRLVFPGTAVAAGPGLPLGLNAVRWQHGQLLVSVLRNAELVAGVETNPQFVYQTPWSGFTNPAVPMLRNASEIPLAPGPGIATGLAEALSQLLGESGEASFQVRLLCGYERQLVAAIGGDGDRLTAPLPVFYVPLEELTTARIAEFAKAADAEAAAWIQKQELVPAPGDAFVFDLAVYAAGDSQRTRPLVELTNLTVRMPAS